LATAVIMPKAGMAMETGTIIQWLKEPGEPVEAGEILLEIETDKVSMEVEAEVSGILLGITHNAGDVVPVTQTIGYIGKAGENMPEEVAGEKKISDTTLANNPNQSQPESQSQSHSQPEPDGTNQIHSASNTPRNQHDPFGKIKATPAAKAQAKARGIDLGQVQPEGDGIIYSKNLSRVTTTGTGAMAIGDNQRISSLARGEAWSNKIPLTGIDGSGSGGRILRKDVSEQGTGLIQSLQALGGFTPPAEVQVSLEPGDTTEPLKGIRKVTAQRMMTSHLTMPPTTLHTDVQADNLWQLKQDVSEALGKKVSLNDLLLKAVALAVRECAWMRVSVFDGQIIHRSKVNLGMAVATDKGLLVPVIPQADTLSLSEIGAKAVELATKARDGKLTVDEMQGATFTVSNLGMYGVTHFTPVINPPEAAILGIGRITPTITKDANDNVNESKWLALSITLDHRIIDGAQGALFLQKLTQIIEKPLAMLA
jgi:pyruvate dehydrogenase E2 component (dihydrolipoamide acetyltransferase)